MEKHVAAEDESVGEAVVGDVPPFGDGGLHSKGGVELNQAVEQLLRSPYHGLVLGKSGVERGNARRLVVAENLLVAVAVRGSAGNHKQHNRRQCYFSDIQHFCRVSYYPSRLRLEKSFKSYK